MKVWLSYPGEAREIVEDRMKKLGFSSFSDYIASLMVYDLWAEKEHGYTGGAVAAGGAAEWRLWEEIISAYGEPTKKRSASFLEHFLAEQMAVGGREGEHSGRVLGLARVLARAEATVAARREVTREEVDEYFLQHREARLAQARVMLEG